MVNNMVNNNNNNMVMAKVTSIIGAWCKEPEYAEHLGAIKSRKNKRRKAKKKKKKNRRE